MGWWKDVIKIYDHRKWPLYTSYGKLYDKFGYDAMNYFAMLGQLLTIYLIIWISSLPMWLAYLLSDNKEFLPLDLNYDPMLDLIAKQEGRGIVWLATIAMMILWSRFVRIQRKEYLDKSGAHTELDRRNIVIMNVPKTMLTEDLVSMLVNETGCTVRKQLRTNSPRSLRQTNLLYKYHRQYLDAMEEQGDMQLSDKQLRWYEFLYRWHLLWLWQILGYYRDQHYYTSRIERQKHRVKMETIQGHYETVLLQLDSPERAGCAIRYLNNTHQFGKYTCHAIQAPDPADVYLENLEYNPVKKTLRYAFTFTIVGLTSLLLFGLVCVFRFQMRDLSLKKQTYWEESVTYYGFFVLVYVSDWVLRPVLYWAQGFERHYSYTDREFFWMLKLYVYQILNKFGIFYSRNFGSLKADDVAHFFDIFGFNTAWRNDTNQGGSDAKFYAYMIVLGYNALDLLVFVFYHVWFRLIAHTKRDKIKAFKNLPLRFASKYVYLLVAFTFILSFGHVVPSIALIIIFYFPFQSLVCRFILMRLASENIKTNHLTLTFCNFIDLACVIAAFCVAQSYIQLNQGFIWLLGPLAIVLLAGITRIGFFDKLLSLMMKRKKHYEPMNQTMTIMETNEPWFQVAPPPISEVDMERLDIQIAQ